MLLKTCSRMEEEDEFYVYVSSLGSSELYKNNTLPQFTNNIYPAIQLRGDWSVGLVDCIYNDWFKIKRHDVQYSTGMSISYFDEKSELIAKEPVLLSPTANIIGTTMEDHIIELEVNFRNTLVRRRIIKDQGELFKYERGTNHILFLPLIPHNGKGYEYSKASVEWFFAGHRGGDLMGGKSMKYNTSDGGISEKICVMNDDLRYISIYSDIISRSFMGDTQVNILDVIPINTSHSFNRAHIKYKKLLRTYIDSISIDLRDGVGGSIPFKDGGSTMCILHFKRT